jgi:quercetin dioxygenase-like cupin family protein
MSVSGKLEPAVNYKLAELIDYVPGAIVSRTLHKSETCNITFFVFDAGQGLTEHTSPFDAYVQVLDGEVELSIGDKKAIAGSGEMVLMPANTPHAVKAEKRFKMLLTMVKS